ncbi:hypothetical protein [Sphingomonas jaspsi]|uniref:hypothetical protein n=1 Tax=Sphingomonas jaspsi TaxID=392409 RepID=UPI0012EB0B37|nr:hypothetical protein [Sphingomonas jaspsi]
MSEPVKQVQKGISWNIWALASVLPLLFGIIIWQLMGLDPESACKLVQAQGQPPGKFCFDLITQQNHIKGWTIWLLIGTVASFVLIVLVAAVKAVVSLVGPGGLSLNVNSGNKDA